MPAKGYNVDSSLFKCFMPYQTFYSLVWSCCMLFYNGSQIEMYRLWDTIVWGL